MWHEFVILKLEQAHMELMGLTMENIYQQIKTNKPASQRFTFYAGNSQLLIHLKTCRQPQGI